MKGKTNTNDTKQIMSHEQIYRIMQWLPIVVSGLFFVKNVVAKEKTAMLAIGVILAVFVGMLVFVRVRKTSFYVKEFTLALALPVLVFAISLFSGEHYSDDFSLFLAVIAITGVYLEPKFTRAQIILSDVLLVLMYMIHPEKAGEKSQYILCVVVFTLAACLNYVLIKRGQGFIRMSDERAMESERLLASIREMGSRLQTDFSASSDRIENSAQELRAESVVIAEGAAVASESCGVVNEKIYDATMQLVELNDEVGRFETALSQNEQNVGVMSQQVETVADLIYESAQVFGAMENRMNHIVGIAKAINDISFKLTILSLNASVEAARAGEAGAGFEVLATEMRALSESSSQFSEQVSDAVKGMLQSVGQTSERFGDSREALQESQKAMEKLVESFGGLNQKFEQLYGNIEKQNINMNEMGVIFESLNKQVSGMYSSALANQDAVTGIADALLDYRKNVDKMVENTQGI